MHVETNHQSQKGWNCFLCEELCEYVDKQSFTNHIRVAHRKDIADEHVDDLVESSRIVRAPILDKCFICSLDEASWTQLRKSNVQFETGNASFLDHIGTCMHSFLLRSLPMIEHDIETQTRSAASAGASNPDSRSWLSTPAFSDRGHERPPSTAELTDLDETDKALVKIQPETPNSTQQDVRDRQLQRQLLLAIVSDSATTPLPESIQTENFAPTESDIQAVGRYLGGKENLSQYSHIPRIYIIPRAVGHLEVIDRFLKERVSDLWLPFALPELQRFLQVLHGETVFLVNMDPYLGWSAFDLSSSVGQPEAYTSAYCAPEVLNQESRTFSSDIWSLGRVFLDIWTVLKGKSPEELIEFVGRFEPLEPDNTASWLEELDKSARGSP